MTSADHNASPANWHVSPGELGRRASALQVRLRARGVGAALVTHPMDLLYFGGGIFAGWMVMPADGDPVLHVRRARDRAVRETCWDVHLTQATAAIADAARKAARGGGLALALDGITGSDLMKVLRAWECEPGDIIDMTHDVRSVRAVKSEWELRWIREAARQSTLAIQHVASCAVPGVREIDMFIAAEIALRKAGHQGPMRMRRHGGEMFFGQVAAGENAAAPASLDAPLGGAGLYPSVGKGASTRVLEAGDLLIVDVMGCCNGYLSDCTRVVAVGGRDSVDEDLLEAQEWCVDLLRTVEKAVFPGAVASEVYDMALSRARADGRDQQFMGVMPDQARFIGHGIGLEVDEYPFLARGFDTKLEPGMVIAIEPKLVFRGRAAVGIEDAFIVTKTGVERLESPDRGVLEGGVAQAN